MPEFIADLTRSMGNAPNSPSAAMAAAELGFKSLFIEAVVFPGDRDEPSLAFCPPHSTPPYDDLGTLSYSQWREKYGLMIDAPCLLDEFAALTSFDRFWVYVRGENPPLSPIIDLLQDSCTLVLDCHPETPSVSPYAAPIDSAPIRWARDPMDCLKWHFPPSRLLSYGATSPGSYRLLVPDQPHPNP